MFLGFGGLGGIAGWGWDVCLGGRGRRGGGRRCWKLGRGGAGRQGVRLCGCGGHGVGSGGCAGIKEEQVAGIGGDRCDGAGWGAGAGVGAGILWWLGGNAGGGCIRAQAGEIRQINLLADRQVAGGETVDLHQGIHRGAGGTAERCERIPDFYLVDNPAIRFCTRPGGG